MGICRILSCCIIVCMAQICMGGQSFLSKVWVSDNGDQTYKNPIINADYSDPDVVRVGNDYYLISSSFNCVPAIPVLHSNDLVNWSIIGHALDRQVPVATYNKPQHGNGVWASAIRYYKNEFYIYYPDPDFGIYMVKAKNPAGPWSQPLLVKSGLGLIDPCPFWDDNGKAYLIHAFAGTRAGIKSVLLLNKMNPEGTEVLDDGILVFDGHDQNPTVEGPKMYKRNGYYYIFAPAGGVTGGWQLALRSKNIYGPYESRVVLEQGKTNINGPHQGAWVETPSGESWFIHFQDANAYGRIVHLQPMKWVNDWPVIGADPDGDGKGEPVLTHKKPNVGKVYPKETPAESDEFDGLQLGMQWQWQANPQPVWAFLNGNGILRLFAAPMPDSSVNLWPVPNILLQKFPAREFTVTAKMSFKFRTDGERAGLIVMGQDYSYISLKKSNGKVYLSRVECNNAEVKGPEIEKDTASISSQTLYFRVKVFGEARCLFSYSENGTDFKIVGEPFAARQGKWIGAKVGLFCSRQGKTNDQGWVDVDWFRVE